MPEEIKKGDRIQVSFKEKEYEILVDKIAPARNGGTFYAGEDDNGDRRHCTDKGSTVKKV